MATHCSTLLLGESHRQRSLAGCSPWSRKESDTTERLTLFTFKKLNRTPPSPDLVKPRAKPRTFLAVPEGLRLLPKHHREGCLIQAFHVKKDVEKVKANAVCHSWNQMVQTQASLEGKKNRQGKMKWKWAAPRPVHPSSLCAQVRPLRAGREGLSGQAAWHGARAEGESRVKESTRRRLGSDLCRSAGRLASVPFAGK